MNELQKIEDISVALNLIKTGEILVSIKGKKTFFALKKDKILCQNSNTCFLLSFQEFSDLYASSIFYIFQQDDNYIDLAKDEEYYNWNVLKK